MCEAFLYKWKTSDRGRWPSPESSNPGSATGDGRRKKSTHYAYFLKSFEVSTINETKPLERFFQTDTCLCCIYLCGLQAIM